MIIKPAHKIPRWIPWLLIFSLAAFLRFHGLAREAFSLDEVFSARIVQYPFSQILPHIPQNKPPLDYYLQKILDPLGRPEVWHRVPAALAGLALAAGVYFWAALWFGRRVGWLAFLLATCNPYLIFYAQEARPYSIFCAAITWQQALLVLWLRRRAEARPATGLWLALLALSLIATTALYAAALVFFAEVLFLFIAFCIPHPGFRIPHPASRTITSFLLLVGIVAALTWPLTLRPKNIPPDLPLWGFQISPRVLFQNLGEYFVRSTNGPAASVLTALALALLALGIAQAWRLSRPGALQLATSALLPLPAAFIFYLIINHQYCTRYTIFVAPGLLILLALGFDKITALICRFGHSGPIRPILSALFVAVFCVATLALSESTRPFKLDWRGFAGAISTRSAGPTRIVVPSLAASIPLQYYLDRLGRRDIELTTQDARAADARQLPTWEVTMSYDSRGRFRKGEFDGIVYERLGEGPRPERFAPLAADFARSPVLNVGACPAELLGEGWSPPEDWGKGFIVRWVTRRQTCVWLPLEGTAPARLTIQLMPYSYPKAPPQSVRPTLEGKPLERRNLPHGTFSTLEWQIPAGTTRRGFNRLDLEFATLQAPSTQKTDYADFRQLAAAVRSIKMQ